MLDLTTLSENTVRKVLTTLRVINEKLDISDGGDRLLVPKNDFTDAGISVSDVHDILKRIDEKENGLISDVTRTAPEQPSPFGGNRPLDLSSFLNETTTSEIHLRSQAEMTEATKQARHVWEETHEKNIAIAINDVVRFRKLYKKIAEHKIHLDSDQLTKTNEPIRSIEFLRPSMQSRITSVVVNNNIGKRIPVDIGRGSWKLLYNIAYGEKPSYRANKSSYDFFNSNTNFKLYKGGYLKTKILKRDGDHIEKNINISVIDESNLTKRKQ